MERYSEKFTDEGADTMALVKNVTGSDLKEWGVKKLHQRVINDGIAKLKSSKNNLAAAVVVKLMGKLLDGCKLSKKQRRMSKTWQHLNPVYYCIIYYNNNTVVIKPLHQPL